MKNIEKVTVGVISKNGMPFLEDCLRSLSQSLSLFLSVFNEIEFILVDSDSSDTSLDAMVKFFNENRGVSVEISVYQVKGDCNAAIARNVILNNCNGSLVFLCDGDIVVNADFLIEASRKIITGQAHAVTGQLSEKWYDSENNFYKTISTRNKISEEQVVRMAGGMILLTKDVVTSGFRYDENLRIYEDVDFSIRISREFKLLAIPTFIGVHNTQPYNTDERFKFFFKIGYNKFLGALLKKHIGSLNIIIEIARKEKGVTIGIIYFLFFVFSLILCLQQVCIVLFMTLSLVFIDFLLQLKKRNLRGFIMYRLLSPIMVVQGFFKSTAGNLVYSIKNIVHD